MLLEMKRQHQSWLRHMQNLLTDIGVACVTAGPGATNAIPGLAEAFVDSAPIMVFSGQVDFKSYYLMVLN